MASWAQHMNYITCFSQHFYKFTINCNLCSYAAYEVNSTMKSIIHFSRKCTEKPPNREPCTKKVMNLSDEAASKYKDNTNLCHYKNNHTFCTKRHFPITHNPFFEMVRMGH